MFLASIAPIVLGSKAMVFKHPKEQSEGMPAEATFQAAFGATLQRCPEAKTWHNIDHVLKGLINSG